MGILVLNVEDRELPTGEASHPRPFCGFMCSIGLRSGSRSPACICFIEVRRVGGSALSYIVVFRHVLHSGSVKV